jgi:flagellar basal-body rod protein FlgB
MMNDPVISSLTRFLDMSVFRSGLILSNMANIDTPGYQARDINFRQELKRASDDDEEGNPMETVSLVPAVHTVRGLIERPDGNNVNLERESMLLADTQLRFDTGVQLLRDRFRMLSSAIHEGSTSS